MLVNVWVSIGVNVTTFALGIAVGVYFAMRRMNGR